MFVSQLISGKDKVVHHLGHLRHYTVLLRSMTGCGICSAENAPQTPPPVIDDCNLNGDVERNGTCQRERRRPAAATAQRMPSMAEETIPPE